MRLVAAKVVLGPILVLLTSQALAFNTSQHRAATTAAVDSLSAANPDLARFGNTIELWSGGVGSTLVPGNATPGEQLAHVLDQTTNICTVPWNGGQFTTIFNRIFTRYAAGNYTGTSPTAEGAYIYIGSALHLIEDQASMPHASNVRHGACPSLISGFDPDNFEGLTKVSAGLAGTPTQGNVEPDQAYFVGLRQARAIVGNYSSPSDVRYWWRNEELTWDESYNPRKIATPYDGEAAPGNELFGAYGGIGSTDVYHDSEQPGLYDQQGKQAKDYAQFFLDKISKLLPPRVSEVAIGGAGGGAPPIINNQSGTPISFIVAENRTDFVDIDIWVQDTGQRIVSDGMTRSLTGFRSASGNTESSSLTGPITWLAQPVQLWGTLGPDQNGQVINALPFESEITLNWKGMVASGAALADGDHTLCFAIKDRDGNGGTCDTSVRSASFSV